MKKRRSSERASTSVKQAFLNTAGKIPSKEEAEKLRFLKDYTFLFIAGIRGFSNQRAEDLSEQVERFGGKVLDLGSSTLFLFHSL